MVGKFLSLFKLSLFRIKFRIKNEHNKTFPVSNFPLKCVSVGKKSYGPLNIIWMAPLSTHLKIGNYCSIGPSVTFLVGGAHNYKRISTYPFQTVVYHEPTRGSKNLDIIIEDDVWIGFDSLVMSGVRIGKGSVIGARSIVSKDIPPYSIFIGNKVVKSRFPDEIISKIKMIDFSMISHDECDEYRQYCQTEIDDNNVDEVLDSFVK